MVLRRIFGPNRNKVTGKWRRLHTKELYALGAAASLKVGLVFVVLLSSSSSMQG
jgi:hypothetical protein